MKKTWFEEAWEDYLFWQGEDKKTLRRINQLLFDISRDPFSGIGKPEPLKGEFSGFWSRRIDETNRLVYRIQNDMLEILSCKGHYS
ncbi:Txe/YoeB family addiction module toxin [Clostridia bacterium]|nr:Txe/YoeB family addiction module toxin [Clostridia bacterium]